MRTFPRRRLTLVVHAVDALIAITVRALAKFKTVLYTTIQANIRAAVVVKPDFPMHREDGTICLSL